MTSQEKFDLAVIGSGPGGHKAAIQALKLGKRVAIIDSNPDIGGNCIHDGTIPSKSFREAIAHLSGYLQRQHYGPAYRVKHDVEMKDLTDRASGIETDLSQTMRSQLQRNSGVIITGFASFVDAHTIKIVKDSTERYINAEKIIIATGTRPVRPDTFDFDGEIILDSDSILRIKSIPKTLTVVGGGIIGIEYGSMFAALGVKVTIVEQKEHLLSFLDREIVHSLEYSLREQKACIITGDKVTSCKKSNDGRAVTYLESGRRVVSEKLLVSAGRTGNIERLGLDNIGLKSLGRGLLEVNEHFQVNGFDHIYAVGDIIGYPALASTAAEQGRRAAAYAFGLGEFNVNLPMPYGIYSIPEIGVVGATEAELKAEKVPYEFGIARFNELERGRILGDDSGILKILFHRNTLKLLGVHIIGEGATELVHIGQTVMAFGGGVDYLVNTVFNYPTLATAYKTAALDGWNKVVAAQGISEDEAEKEEEKKEKELH